MIWAAFLIGIVGSFHCVGMCGPIALALPVPQGKNRYVAIALYNLGRITMYGLFGFLFGSFGSLLIIAGFQQLLSIIAGITLLTMVLLSLVGNFGFSSNQTITKAIQSLKFSLGNLLTKHSLSSFFTIGLLNGLLPCGLVYMAIIGAIATGNGLTGSYYMMLFGLGTVPAMFMISAFKNTIPTMWRLKLTKTIPVVVSIIGVMLVLRGLNLGIPYLSPAISSEDPAASRCCAKTKCH